MQIRFFQRHSRCKHLTVSILTWFPDIRDAQISDKKTEARTWLQLVHSFRRVRIGVHPCGRLILNLGLGAAALVRRRLAAVEAEAAAVAGLLRGHGDDGTSNRWKECRCYESSAHCDEKGMELNDLID